MGKARFYLHENFYWIELDEDVCDMVFNEVDRILMSVALPIKLCDFVVEAENIQIQIEINPALKALIHTQLDGIQNVNQ